MFINKLFKYTTAINSGNNLYIKLLSNLKKSTNLNSINQRRYYKKIYQVNNEINKTENKTETNCDGKIKKWPSDNKIQYNFHPEIEAALNQQINMEFKAFYNYLSMVDYFYQVKIVLHQQFYYQLSI